MRALELIEGADNKAIIASRTVNLLRKMGKDVPNDVRKHLDQDRASGFGSDDEGDDDDGSWV